MNPYEKTAAEMGRQSQAPGRLAKGLAPVAATAATAAFAPLLARAAPFLSNYIPQDMAIKGLSKIHPKLGEFVQKAMNEGFDFEEAKDFLGEQVNQSAAAKSEPAKQTRNIVEQYSPELHQFITEQIQKGKSPLEAGSMATLDQTGRKSFKKAIEKLVKDHKAPWASIIESVYGSPQTPQQPQGTQQPQQEAQMQQAQSQGGLDPAVAQILQQGAAILQRFKGQ